MGTTIAGDLERRLLRPAGPERFGPAELDGLPEPVRRHLTQAIDPGPRPCTPRPGCGCAGPIKVGRWLPFRARQVAQPAARLRLDGQGGRATPAVDRYLDGAGAMRWKLAGLVTVAAGEGADISRSAAARAGAEGDLAADGAAAPVRGALVGPGR